jgi:nucleotide-binding universal stress UspA family protein
MAGTAIALASVDVTAGSHPMAFETLLINADSEANVPRLLAVAQFIAARQHTRLVALYVLPPSLTLPAGTPGAPDTVKLQEHRTRARAEAERARRLFERTTAETTDRCTWQLDEGDGRNEIDSLVAHGRLADLIVSSNVQAGGLGSSQYHSAERLIVEAGRPVVLVPKEPMHASCGNRVLVAWNGSREAARALFDALPLLQAAQQVKVLQVGTSDGMGFTGLSGPVVCAMLSRHGVRATSETLSLPRATAGAALLSAVKAENADLLVMGGYGHWRFRELILGGATRHVLRHMSVAVLMSH